MAKAERLGSSFPWGDIASLRIRSRLVAEGVYAGAHRSARRGSGIEFGGHREYVPGDDLRWLDRRALLRHGRHLIRQFETETDRALRLVVDASASMGYRGSRAPETKLGVSAVLAAALARIAVASGDPIGLTYLGGGSARPVAVSGGREAFDRLIGSLEDAKAEGDAVRDPDMLERSFAILERAARRGSVVVLLSDLIDLPRDTAEHFSAMASRGRSVVVVRVLAPDEIDLPFDGTVRLRSLEGDVVVETDTAVARDAYLAALGDLATHYETTLLARGAKFLRVSTADDPVDSVRAIVGAVR
ncbi:MAG TPA: DUF58 domain-containing protein [Polyangiaceae bacterium]|jgi:uncharacterized protein (DUF58 family)|nr:DUF58 domain-containing protein [Polyangiaceae bacterium]